MTTRLHKTRHHLEKASLAVHTKLLIQERLGSLLASVHPSALTLSNPNTLAFEVSDLVDPDPLYSGTVPIKLFIENRSLTLTLFDRKEILMEHTEQISFELLNYPSPYALLRLTLTPSTLEPPFQFAFFFNTPERE